MFKERTGGKIIFSSGLKWILLAQWCPNDLARLWDKIISDKTRKENPVTSMLYIPELRFTSFLLNIDPYQNGFQHQPTVHYGADWQLKYVS